MSLVSQILTQVPLIDDPKSSCFTHVPSNGGNQSSIFCLGHDGEPCTNPSFGRNQGCFERQSCEYYVTGIMNPSQNNIIFNIDVKRDDKDHVHTDAYFFFQKSSLTLSSTQPRLPWHMPRLSNMAVGTLDEPDLINVNLFSVFVNDNQELTDSTNGRKSFGFRQQGSNSLMMVKFSNDTRNFTRYSFTSLSLIQNNELQSLDLLNDRVFPYLVVVSKKRDPRAKSYFKNRSYVSSISVITAFGLDSNYHKVAILLFKNDSAELNETRSIKIETQSVDYGIFEGYTSLKRPLDKTEKPPLPKKNIILFIMAIVITFTILIVIILNVYCIYRYVKHETADQLPSSQPMKKRFIDEDPDFNRIVFKPKKPSKKKKVTEYNTFGDDDERNLIPIEAIETFSW
jgi:hypothetical protein